MTTNHLTTRPTTAAPVAVDVLVWSHGEVDVLHICAPGQSRIEVVAAGQVRYREPTTRQWQRERMRARR